MVNEQKHWPTTLDEAKKILSNKGHWNKKAAIALYGNPLTAAIRLNELFKGKHTKGSYKLIRQLYSDMSKDRSLQLIEKDLVGNRIGLKPDIDKMEMLFFLEQFKRRYLDPEVSDTKYVQLLSTIFNLDADIRTLIKKYNSAKIDEKYELKFKKL